MLRWVLISVVIVAGETCIALGAWSIYPPAGLIVAGVELILAGYVTADLTSPEPPGSTGTPR